MDEVELEFTDEALVAVAQKALELKTGARGLRSIMEEAMLEVMYTTPSDKSIKKIIVTKECITEKAIAQIMRDENSELLSGQTA